MLHRLLQEFKGAVVPILYPMVMGVEKLSPGLIPQPVVLDSLESFVEAMDGAWCFGRLVLDQIEPCLDLLPESCLAFFPDAAGFGCYQGKVLGGQGGATSLWCPWVLLQ